MNKELERQSTTQEFRQQFYKTNNFTKSLTNQTYASISKQRDKWTDELFPAEEISLYSGKTEFSNHIGPHKVPEALTVSISNNFRNTPRTSTFLSSICQREKRIISGKD